MFSNIFIILINILFLIFSNYKYKYENDYIKEKWIFYLMKIKRIISIINIANIVISCSYYFINGIEIIDVILFVVSLLLFALIIFNKFIYEFKIIDKGLINNYDIMLSLSAISVLSAERFSHDYALNVIYFSLNMILIVTSIVLLIIKVIKYKEYVSFNSNDENFLSDIKFSLKVEINKLFDHVIYITAFIVFIFIRIPFIFIFYILLFLLLIYIIKKKIDKISNESKRIYKAITIAKEEPGVVYAFQFTRDLLFLKKLIIITIIYSISILSVYLVGESAFAIISLNMYLFILYTIVSDKIYLIRYIKSLNEDYIDKNKYSILVNKKISYIDIIKFFNIKLYRLIICDNIIYKSNIILYDPEVVIKDIYIAINKSNIDDYITLESTLYESSDI